MTLQGARYPVVSSARGDPPEPCGDFQLLTPVSDEETGSDKF